MDKWRHIYECEICKMRTSCVVPFNYDVDSNIECVMCGRDEQLKGVMMVVSGSPEFTAAVWNEK